MSVTPESQPPRRVPWKLWHLLLVPLPGLVYLLVFSQIIHSLQETLVALWRQRRYESGNALYLQTAVWSFACTLPVLVLAAVILTKASRPEKPLSFSETILTCFFLTGVNIVIAGAGCSFLGAQ